MIRTALLASAFVATLAACAAPGPAPTAPGVTAPDSATDSAALAAAIAGSWRDPAHVARDGYRHPQETLMFFGVRPTDTVIEITPGGGWYADILGPYLQARGRYIAAVVDPAAVAEGRSREYQQKNKDTLAARLAAAPAQFAGATVVGYDPKAPRFGPDGSADRVLTFRNVHNWRSAGHAEGMFRGFHAVLKPGGVLGVVEHRAVADVPADDKTGYVGQAQVIAMAEAAGFRLDGSSEVNANPRDTKDHPKGVWTLPPSNDHDPEDAGKYAAIGESDRMTLRFVKPAP